MHTVTLPRTGFGHLAAEPLPASPSTTIASLLGRLNALPSKLRHRPTRVGKRTTAALLSLADAYEASQPSYAADLRAAALTAIADTPAR